MKISKNNLGDTEVLEFGVEITKCKNLKALTLYLQYLYCFLLEYFKKVFFFRNNEIRDKGAVGFID